jgi:hypothetical protein
VFLAAVVILTFARLVPVMPGMPRDGLDPSWAFGMNEAVAQGMSVGTDIVFTYGPYASLHTHTYHPATDSLMLWGSVFLAAILSVAAYRTFRHAGWPSRLAFIAGFATMPLTQGALFLFYPLLIGVGIYQDASAISAGRSRSSRDLALVAALLAPCGLLPLIKGTMLLACLATCLPLIAYLASRRDWTQCLLVAATPLVSLVLFWKLSGQPLGGLADYLTGLGPMISGFTDAMATDGHASEWVLYLLAVAVLMAILLGGTPGSWRDRSFLALMFLAIHFLAFKAGFVRHDGHARIAANTIFLGALLAGTLTGSRAALVLLAVCIPVSTHIAMSHPTAAATNRYAGPVTLLATAWNGILRRVTAPDALPRDFAAHLDGIRRRAGIPRLEGTADIYPVDQSRLIASGNAWHPRPVFQSYSAYTPALANLNKNHLLGPRRPANILFAVQPIDNRLPALEDGPSWPILLAHYEPTARWGDYLHLVPRRSSGQTVEYLTAIGGGVYSLGQWISLPESRQPLFARVRVCKNLTGSILTTLFKPSRLSIKLMLRNGATRDYRTVAGMSEAGFMISPLLETTEDLAKVYIDPQYLDDKRVDAMQIGASGQLATWSDAVEVEFHAIRHQPSRDFLAKTGFARPRLEASPNAAAVGRCVGSIDSVNGRTPSSTPIEASAVLHVRGWLAVSVAPAELPDDVHVFLSDNQGRRYGIDTRRKERLDVGEHFNRPALNECGYEATADISLLQGDFELSLVYTTGSKAFACPQCTVPVRIRPAVERDR